MDTGDVGEPRYALNGEEDDELNLGDGGGGNRRQAKELVDFGKTLVCVAVDISGVFS